MPELGVATGKAETPRLKLLDVVDGDFESLLFFSGGMFRYWVRHEKDTPNNRWKKMSRFDLKVKTSDAGGEVKVTDVEKVAEQHFTFPALPEPNEADGMYRVYYASYSFDVTPDHPCFAQAVAPGAVRRIALRNAQLTEIDSDQPIPPTATTPKLKDFLKKNHAFKTTQADNRAKFSTRNLSAQGNNCVLGNPTEGLVAIAGMGLTDQDVEADYSVIALGVAIY